MVPRQIRGFAALFALAAAIGPLAVSAQDAPPQDAPVAAPAPPVAPPSYARPSYGSNDEVITGRVQSFDGAYSLQVRDDRGFIDNVKLRQGTVINPTGLRLAPGMSVTIHGVNQGNAFAANEIDTPYQSYGVAPYGPYPYAAYPYGVYPYPGFGWWGGPVGIGIGFHFGGYGGYGGYHRW